MTVPSGAIVKHRLHETFERVTHVSGVLHDTWKEVSELAAQTGNPCFVIIYHPQGIAKVLQVLPMILEDAKNGLPWDARAWLQALATELCTLDHGLRVDRLTCESFSSTAPVPSSEQWSAKQMRRQRE
jgi:hypothetical protein